MRVAELRKPNSHIAPLEFGRPDSCAEEFSRMWKYSTPSSVRLSIGTLGMVNVSLDPQRIRKASLALAESVREFCLWDVKQHETSSGLLLFCDWTVPQAKNLKTLHFDWDHHAQAVSVGYPLVPLSSQITRDLELEGPWERLSGRFYFRDRRSVTQFLERNFFLVNVLFEVREKFDQYFSTDTRSALEVFTDPEDNNSVPKLFALILTTLSSNDASTRLDRLDQEWWLDQPREVRRVLNIDVDYIDGV